MGNTIEQLGMEAGSSAIGAGMGMLLGKWNDKRQLEQQGKLQKLQIGGNKEMMDYQMMKQLEMWKNTNYGAQVAEMSKAGINPALLYGMSGGGGTTTGNAGGGVQGGSAPVGGREVQDIMGLQMQRELLKAQKENIEADTANKLSQVPGNQNIPRVQNQGIKESEGRISLMAQQESNEQVKNNLLRIEQSLAETKRWINDTTTNEQREAKLAELKQMIAENRSAQVKAGVDEKTADAQVEKLRAEVAGEWIHNNLMNAQINVSNQQVQTMINEVAQKWQSLRIDEQELYVKQYLAKITSAAIPAYMATDIVKTIGGLGIASGILRPTQQGPTPVQGFGRGNKN